MKKRINRNKLPVFVLLLFTVCSTQIFSQEEEKIAGLYLNTADSFFSRNDILKAEVFLNKSLLYYKDSSDAYFLKSLIEEKKTGLTGKIINDLKKALILRNWNLYSEEEAFFQLGKIYSKIKEYKKAVSTLYVIEGEKIDNETYLDVYSNSLLNSGMFVTASEILETAVEKFPDNNNFKKKLITADKGYYDRVLLKILDKNNVYNFDTEIILEILKNTDDEGIKRELFEKIASEYHEYPEIIIEKIKIENQALNEDIDSFFENRGYEKLKLIKELRSLLNDEVLGYFNKKISELSGIISEDFNSDGLSEIVFRIENGVLIWYREDYNQDGLNDFYLYYTDGNIDTIEYNEDILVKYYHYPLVETVIINRDNISVYDFSKRNTLFEAVQAGDLLNLPEIYKDFQNRVDKILPKAVISQKNYEDKSSRIMEYKKNDRIKMYSEIHNERTVSEGIIKDGSPLFIDRDNNGENNYETREIYKNGNLERILYDGDNDGIYELKIEDSCKYWDFNNDGIYEIYEKKEGDSVLTGYSRKFDGLYDIEEKRTDGKIVSVRKGDKWFPVFFDRKNKLFWINKKPDNVTINELKDNIYLNIDNFQIHIYKIADNYYAEVIN